MRETIKRGEMVYVNMGRKRDHVMSGCRPCVVVSADKGNRSSPNVTVVPMTSKRKRQETQAEVYCRVKSTVLCEGIQTVSKKQIGNRIGRCTENEMREIERALRIALGMEK